MATILYLHDETYSGSGTMPSAPQATETVTSSFTGSSTLRLMDTNVGTSQTFLQLDESADISHATFVGWWATPPLDAQTIVSASTNNLNIQCANSENSSSMNFGGSYQWAAYIWRPSTGTRVQFLGNIEALSNEIEPNAVDTQKYQDMFDITINDTATCEAGDIVIFELYAYWNPSGSASYTAKFFYDGTDTTKYTRNTTVSDTASSLQFEDDTWTFQVITNDFNMDATASVTWSGESTATSNLDADAAAALTWAGAATAASDFDQDAVASVTWTGLSVQIEAADLSAAAAASVTWNGVTIANAALDSDAAASLTWNGAATAASAYDSDAAASLTWNGTSIAASDFDSDALADLQWVSEVSATAAGDFDMDAAASVTWGGTGLYPAALSAAAAATLEWGGTGLAPGAFDAAAAAALAAAGASDASADWAASPAATLTWDGEEVAAPGEAAWSADAVADLTATGESIAAAAASMEATASLIMRGIDASPAERNIDGLVRRRSELDRIEEFDEEDILILTAALYSYLEQSNGY